MESDILTSRQITLLKYMGKADIMRGCLYLTGGTPLAAFYLHHRYSEDLDFFSEQEIELSGLQVMMKEMKVAFDIARIDFQQSFNRNLFFLHFKDEVIKTEFTYFPFPRIEKGPLHFGVRVDSLLDIAVNKLFTIYQRTHARDYIDLFYICQKKDYTISELISRARIKFDWYVDPLQLGAQFVKAEETLDMPRMIQEIDHAKWRNFFIAEAKKLKSEVLE